MNRRVWTRGLLTGAVAMSFGCSTFVSSVMDRAASRSGDVVGERVGNQVGNQIAADYSPMMMQSMTRMMFVYAFNGVGGYAVNQTAYKPGQYTRWNIPRKNDEKPVTLERAYLANDADGNQWWKVKMVMPKNTDAAQEGAETQRGDDTLIYEALFSPDGSKLLRLRAKMPNDKEGKELPVEENTYGYAAPHKLTAQSLKGADKGVESVTVPAGSFKAHHLVFGSYSGDAEFWESSKVPGGTVKYGNVVQGQEGSDGQHWMAELAAYGDDAKSELNSL